VFTEILKVAVTKNRPPVLRYSGLLWF